MSGAQEHINAHSVRFRRIDRLSLLALISSLLCSCFILLLYYGYYSDDNDLLLILNYLKYLIILLLGVSLYQYYKTKSDIIIIPILVALAVVWFAGFDAAYRWDAIQHVARANFYLGSDVVTFFSSSERTSFVYVIWGFMYRLFGESEVVTHLTNMAIGFAGICGIFLLAKEIYGKFEAVLAVIIALTLPAFFIVNKWAYLDMPLMSFSIFSILFLVKYVKTPTNSFLWLSLIFAFFSTGIKEPGILLFPLIIITLSGYRLLSRSTLIPVLIGFIASLSLLAIMMSFVSPHIGSEFSIITPFYYGLDAFPLWLSSLNQQTLMILCSGLLFLSIVPFFTSERSSMFYISILVAQVMTIIGLSLFPSQFLFEYPVIPYHNYTFYYGPLALVALTIVWCLLRKKISLNWLRVKESGILLLFAGLFILFFMINSRMVGNGIEDIIDMVMLDFRYLIPALPAFIILCAKGVETALSSNARPLLKKGFLLIVSVIIVINLIMSFNLVFYYASSGDSHLEGYQIAKTIPDNDVIYTYWPFYYFPEDIVMDVGKYDWKSSKMTQKCLYTRTILPGSAVLFNSHFLTHNDVQFINVTTIESRSPYLDPLFPSVSQKTADTVSFGKNIDNPYECGTIISFGAGGNAQQYQVSGWSFPEYGITWTSSQKAVLAVQPQNTSSDLILKFAAYPYLAGGAIERQRVTVIVNREPIGEWVFDEPGIVEQHVVIPRDVLFEEIQYITLELHDAQSSRDHGLSVDGRPIALAAHSLVLYCPVEYECGTIIQFGKNGTAEQYQVSGWSFPEEGYTWTDGKRALLAIKPEHIDSDLTLKLAAYPSLVEGVIDRQRVTVVVNGQPIGEWTFDQPRIVEQYSIIPRDVLFEEIQYITFELHDAQSAKDLGLSLDGRQIALAAYSVVLHSPEKYECGTVLSFGTNGNAQQYQLSGWSHPEEGFTWTDGENALLAVQLENPESNLTLTLSAFPYLEEGILDHQRVIVSVNEEQVGEWLFDQPRAMEQKVVIPSTVLQDGVQYITLTFPDAGSKTDHTDDPRDLSLAVLSMRIDCW